MANKETKRFSFYCSKEYAERIEQLAKENGVSVNGMMNVLIRQAIDSKKSLDTMTEFMTLFVNMAKDGRIDDIDI